MTAPGDLGGAVALIVAAIGIVTVVAACVARAGGQP